MCSWGCCAPDLVDLSGVGEIIFKMSCSVCGFDNRKSSVRVIVVHLGWFVISFVRSEQCSSLFERHSSFGSVYLYCII